MTRKAIVIEPGYADYIYEKEILGPLGFEIETANSTGDRAALKAALAEAEIVFVRDSVLDADLIGAMAQAKGVVRYGIGVDTIDLDAAKAKGIIVARVNDYGADIEVADHTVALLLAAARRIVSRDRDVRKGAWQVGQAEPVRRIAGSVLGLVGCGRIARAVADRMRAFGVTEVIAYDPFLDISPDGIRLVSVEDLAAEADFVSLHAPATEDNHHLVNAALLSRMQPHAILINTARGPLVDEAALCGALSAGQIRAAALDVFSVEPPKGNPLLDLPNVILTDHCAWYSEATAAAIQKGAAEQARDIIETGTSEFRVA